MELFSFKGLSFSYPGSEKKALSDIKLSIDSGDFVIICGKTGCSKTTLLKMIKPELSPVGSYSGEIFYKGKNIRKPGGSVSAGEIGFVMQNPENQTVTDSVWRELAFTLENLGMPQSQMRARVAETASYFGITSWFNKKISELSGGQKQLLNLAAVMISEPDILLLDEPCAQLSPIAAEEFISTLKKIRSELGVTVVIAEHSPENIFETANKLVIMDEGKIISVSSPEEPKAEIINPNIIKLLPSSLQIYYSTGSNGSPPLTVGECRKYLSESFDNKIRRAEHNSFERKGKPRVEVKNLSFGYSQNESEILTSLNLRAYPGEHLCVLGANGCGKTTLIKLIGGILSRYGGNIIINGKNIKKYKGGLFGKTIAFLPQNPQLAFLMETVYEDLYETCAALGIDKAIRDEKIREISDIFEIDGLFDMHPYDLSGGEQQKAALAKLLLIRPQILLLDEPVKSLDAYSKEKLYKILLGLKNEGMTIISASHDAEFAAKTADSVALLFNGEIACEDNPSDFFSRNRYYTTSASRISRGFYDNAVTNEDVINLSLSNERRF